jgi:hypothetical protein
MLHLSTVYFCSLAKARREAIAAKIGDPTVVVPPVPRLYAVFNSAPHYFNSQHVATQFKANECEVAGDAEIWGRCMIEHGANSTSSRVESWTY